MNEHESLLVDEAQESDFKSAYGDNRIPLSSNASLSLIKLEERFNQMKKHRMSQINKETLDYLYVKFPNKDDWKKYYVRYQNSQLLFFNSVKVRMILDAKVCRGTISNPVSSSTSLW
jgi:hypothetical protein